MLDVLIDTSSLISFAKAAKLEFPPKNNTTFSKVQPGLESTIEALVLYDNIWVDGPSINRNRKVYPYLDSIISHCKILELNHSDEQLAYSSINELYNNIQGDSKTINLFRGYTEDWLSNECLISYIYPSAKWVDVENDLPENLKQIAKKLRIKLGEFVPFSGAACLAIIRTIYYQALQRKYGTDLLLHPWKGAFYEQNGYGANIINMFDEGVRNAFYRRKEKWLGGKELEIKFPLITQHVLKQSKSWEDVLNKSIELRLSKEAKGFRQAVNDLVSALKNNDNVLVDEILSSLDSAQVIWKKQLGGPLHPERKITFTVPFINVGTEFRIKNKLWRNRSGDKILIFIHKLLRYS